MRNNPRETKMLDKANVMYQFDCPYGDCRLRNVHYVGFTLTTLSRRLTTHLRESSIKNHMSAIHNRTLTRSDLTNNTKVIHTNDARRIEICEAIHIRDHAPPICSQKNNRLEKLALWGTKQQASLQSEPRRQVTAEGGANAYAHTNEGEGAGIQLRGGKRLGSPRMAVR